MASDQVIGSQLRVHHIALMREHRRAVSRRHLQDEDAMCGGAHAIHRVETAAVRRKELLRIADAGA